MKGIGFLPWTQNRHPAQKFTKKIYLPKMQPPALFDMDCLHAVRDPFLSLPDAQGTLQFFLQALRQKRDDEALGYVLPSLWHEVDLGELRELFSGEKHHFFISTTDCTEKRLSIAQEREQTTEIFSVHLKSHPDAFGKWKISAILREEPHKDYLQKEEPTA